MADTIREWRKGKGTKKPISGSAEDYNKQICRENRKTNTTR